MRSVAAASVVALVVSACGLAVRSPDLFLLTRTGERGKLTLLVNDGGTIRCNGKQPRQLSDALLLQARDLASGLGGDAKQGLRVPSEPNSVYEYTIRLQGGTISFPDSATAGGRYPRLAQAELFALQAAQQACGLGG
jgi:hypothetical protein